jgi:hypothetical protein
MGAFFVIFPICFHNTLKITNPNMTDETQTSLSDFLSFINGNTVAVYGDAEDASRVKPTLESCMKQAVKNANNLWQEQAAPFKDTKGYDPFGLFLAAAYEEFLLPASRGLRMISPKFQDAWRAHFNSFQEQAKQLETNPDVLGSTANMKLPDPEDAQDVADAALDKISRTLLEWYYTFLVNENNRAQAGQYEFGFGGGRRTQQNVSTIQHEKWVEAWETEFRGDVLNRLELKLHSNSVAVTTDETKTRMSRIIPVVQSSGTGKSRLAEE